MATLTAEGIIVKRTNFGEADRILTIVTPFKGKITVLAKGVRRITSRRGGNVETLNKIKFQIFQGSGMPILTEAESIKTYPKIKNNLLLSSYGSYISELVERFLPENQQNLPTYKILNTILDLLEENPRQVFLRAFEVKLLSLMGYWSLDDIQAGEEIKEVLNNLQQGSWEEISQLPINHGRALEVERILRYYIEKVLEGSLKSLNVLDKIKKE